MHGNILAELMVGLRRTHLTLKILLHGQFFLLNVLLEDIPQVFQLCLNTLNFLSQVPIIIVLVPVVTRRISLLLRGRIPLFSQELQLLDLSFRWNGIRIITSLDRTLPIVLNGNIPDSDSNVQGALVLVLIELTQRKFSASFL